MGDTHSVRSVAVMLREARQAAGNPSRAKVAACAGVGEATIKVAERTGATSTKTLCALASAYGMRLVLVPAHAQEAAMPHEGRGDKPPRRREDAPGHGSTEESREQSAS